MTLMLVDEVHYDTWGSLLHSVQTGESNFEHLHGMSFFEYIQENPATGEVFDRAMTENSSKKTKAILANYNFAEVKTVVDVGGGVGILIADILKNNPHLKGILLELPHVIKKALPLLKNAGANDRCQLIEGDFFTTIPTGGDVYLLKNVIHDWDDEKAIAILRNCRRAMGQKGKLLVIERIILPGNEPAFGKLLDLEMLVMTSGGRERTEAEFRELLKTAGFQLTKIIPTPEDVGILESVIL
jgi:SAM-dependent methyltransferase